MREMSIWPQYAAKCCKNAGKFFPDLHILGPAKVAIDSRSLSVFLAVWRRNAGHITGN